MVLRLGYAVSGTDVGYAVTIRAGKRRSFSCMLDVRYTPKSDARNRIPCTSCTEIAVSCIGFRGVQSLSAIYLCCYVCAASMSVVAA
eukprot:1883349-Rhodomonas_salina.4